MKGIETLRAMVQALHAVVHLDYDVDQALGLMEAPTIPTV